MIIFQIFIYLMQIYFVNSFGFRTKIRIDRFDVCNVTANSPFLFDVYKFTTLKNGAYSISCGGEATRDINKFYVNLNAKRCATKETLDTCEPFSSLRPIDTCGFINIKGTSWSGIVHAFEPPVSCPIKRGKYVARNATLDPAKSFFIPLETWYWILKIKIKADDSDEHLMICLDFQSFKIRN